MPVQAKHLHPEKYYQNMYCAAYGGQTEYVLSDNTRVDCLTDTQAIEFGFVDHKYEDVGQSLYYALMTGKKPAIATIIEDESKGYRHLRILQKLCDKYAIELIVIRP